MLSDSGILRSESGEESDALDGLFPVARWYDPCERAFRGSDELEACYFWSIRCTRALDEIRKNIQTSSLEYYVDYEYLASNGHSYSFVTALAELTLAEHEHLTRKATFGSITEQLAARRLLAFGDDNSRATVCGRPYPSALDGLLDVHKRVSVLVHPLGEAIISVVASAIPEVMSRTPHLAPFYAGCADKEIVPDVGLDPCLIQTLRACPEFREAVTNAYRKYNEPRITSEIHGFDGQAVQTKIKAELSLLSLERTPLAEIPASVKLGSDSRTNPVREGPIGQARLSPCHSRAFGEFRSAAQALGDNPTDPQAYEWLKEHEVQILLPFATWARYVREARRKLGLKKNSPRGGRTGGSVARWDEVEGRP
jgi:hypothetical protein